jgi:hypothetical protein
MRYSTLSILTLAAPLVAHAAPARRAPSANDILVLTFADVLEQLESGFYAAGISKFKDADFSAAGFTSPTLVAQQLTAIQSDEATHSTILQATLASFGAQPLTSCNFNFDPALPDVATMAATARVVEFVGVSAYLGGATLLDDPVLLDSAGSILSIEARHSTVLNILSGTGVAVPQAFDIPLTPSEVLAIASPFISGCDLGVPANPNLAITNTGSVGPGTLLTFSSTAITGSTDNLFCQMMIGGAPFSITLPLSQCIVPANINGPVAIWITSDGNPLANNVRDRATDKQVAGPVVAFIDSQVDMLAQLARTSSSNSGANSGESVTTQTISPEEASSIIAGATQTQTASGASSTGVNSSSSSGVSVSSTPNLSTGTSSDGKITVDGWSNLPGQSSTGSSSGVSNAAGAPGTGLPNLSVGPSPDGKIDVDGWSNLPSGN